jgi:hypothetical protein
LSIFRNRTCYTLARLLFMADAPSRFKAFMTPLQRVSGPGYVLLCHNVLHWFDLGVTSVLLSFTALGDATQQVQGLHDTPAERECTLFATVAVLLLGF